MTEIGVGLIGLRARRAVCVMISVVATQPTARNADIVEGHLRRTARSFVAIRLQDCAGAG